MSRLAGASDGMIGVDTHRDTLAAATTDPVGGLLAQASVRADGAGYRRLLDFALARVPRRPWTPSAPPGRRCGCCWPPPQRLRGQGQRHQSTQGADRWGARGAPGRATRPGHQAPDQALREAAGPADPIAGAPHDGPGAALDRPPHPAAGRRGRRAAG
jgi:hypothetical protein